MFHAGQDSPGVTTEVIRDSRKDSRKDDKERGMIVQLQLSDPEISGKLIADITQKPTTWRRDALENRKKRTC